mgnify:CR=1 FL=1
MFLVALLNAHLQGDTEGQQDEVVADQGEDTQVVSILVLPEPAAQAGSTA